ncbi:AraC family transcriptional regulator [Paenibacillus hodogayensis]|uniref:AraC family transcriptional regulator n=1 Tax=Paenibacillus hodogayensis TaxID=279208 RepID=A0ABV5VWZ5_9BACL
MEIISVGHSIHTKPFYTDKRGGLGHYIVRLQTDGACRVVVNGVTHRLGPGDLLLCRPGDSYELTIGENAGPSFRSIDYFLLISAEQSWFAEWWERYRYIGQCQLGLDDDLIAMWKLIRYEKRRLKKMDPVILECLVHAFFLHLGRLISEGKRSTAYERSVASGIKYFIDKRAPDKLMLKEICAHAGLSVSRASQLFKSAFNQSIMDYVIETRLTMAKEYILVGGTTLEEVAYRSGFSSYIHFSRTFRSRYGVSPSDFKKTALSIEERANEPKPLQ